MDYKFKVSKIFLQNEVWVFKLIQKEVPFTFFVLVNYFDHFYLLPNKK